VARKWEEDGPGKIDYSEKSGQQEVLIDLALLRPPLMSIFSC
jgi:hypothetical protein